MRPFIKLSAIGVSLFLSLGALLTALNNYVPSVRSLYVSLAGKESAIYLNEHLPKIYSQTPLAAQLHVTFGFLMIVLWPVQFWPWLRKRHQKVHRFLGGGFIFSGVVVALSAMTLGVVVPYSGHIESFFTVLTSGIFLFCLYKALVTIKKGERVAHKEWIIRALALAFGIVTQRMWFSSDFFLPLNLGPKKLFVVTALLGFYGNLLMAELGIKYLKKKN